MLLVLLLLYSQITAKSEVIKVHGILFPGSQIVSAIIFRFLIHFELLFMYSMK